MRIKHRMVGPDNPFHTKNVPPEQYRIPEKVTLAPNKVDTRGFDGKKIPFSGKLGPLGYQLIADHKKSSAVTHFNWHEEQFKSTGSTPRNPYRKPVPAVEKISSDNFEKQGGVDYKQQNFSILHRPQIYPAAENIMNELYNRTPTLQSPFKNHNAEQIKRDLS